MLQEGEGGRAGTSKSRKKAKKGSGQKRGKGKTTAQASSGGPVTFMKASALM